MLGKSGLFFVVVVIVCTGCGSGIFAGCLFVVVVFRVADVFARRSVLLVDLRDIRVFFGGLEKAFVGAWLRFDCRLVAAIRRFLVSAL